MKESDFYGRLKNNFKRLRLVRIENAISSGVPDVVAVRGGGQCLWLELKVSRNGSVPPLRPTQRSWHIYMWPTGLISLCCWIEESTETIHLSKINESGVVLEPFKSFPSKKGHYVELESFLMVYKMPEFAVVF